MCTSLPLLTVPFPQAITGVLRLYLSLGLPSSLSYHQLNRVSSPAPSSPHLRGSKQSNSLPGTPLRSHTMVARGAHYRPSCVSILHFLPPSFFSPSVCEPHHLPFFSASTYSIGFSLALPPYYDQGVLFIIIFLQQEEQPKGVK